ncbi:hypothetical protein PPERSA_06952 [Pseudocohnilembus persalinus]|uniref:Uncharacterized protein n=1 Tax=Pseudocohnilembus persalinus TaxID=266149 RepID=A0A0V0QYD9_PSEPJ|nr:hypothetical protein PPERSA_06952 [Pseudocohnilembus persalinus]|eukprot:KRX07337.1 hypothetical protein PPERSA_06952 [Pseudocohnilembus persalinus]
MLGLDDKGYNSSALIEEYSPSLPKGFPKSNLPQNLCEPEFLKLLKCTKYVAERDACQLEYTSFLTCKKERDLTIFSSIKDWEQGHFKNLSDKNKNFYVMGLGRKLDRLEEDYEKIPTSYTYQIKAWTFKADIEQLKWRINYLNKYKKKLEQEQQEHIEKQTQNNLEKLNSMQDKFKK